MARAKRKKGRRKPNPMPTSHKVLLGVSGALGVTAGAFLARAGVRNGSSVPTATAAGTLLGAIVTLATFSLPVMISDQFEETRRMRERRGY